MARFYNLAAEPDSRRQSLFKLLIRGHVQADDEYLQAPIFKAALDWERIKGRVPLHEIYIAYTQEKLIPKTPNLTGIF